MSERKTSASVTGPPESSIAPSSSLALPDSAVRRRNANEKAVDVAPAVQYFAPAIEDFGSIADHTFQTPGKGTKSTDTTFVTDKYHEFSHPASGS